MKKILFLLGVLVLGLIAFVFPFNKGRGAQLQVSLSTDSSGLHYTWYNKGRLHLRFTDERPDKHDSSILLCIPAAFTRLTDYKVDGFYMVNGQAKHADSVNYTIDGALKISGGKVSTFSSHKGKIFTPGFIDSLSKEKASVFQQLQLIRDFKTDKLKDHNPFQCRGIALMKDGTVSVVESEEDITLRQFAKGVNENGNVRDLIYTDMGAWDEGWVRVGERGEQKAIGRNRSQTARQSNWLVFEKMK